MLFVSILPLTVKTVSQNKTQKTVEQQHSERGIKCMGIAEAQMRLGIFVVLPECLLFPRAFYRPRSLRCRARDLDPMNI